MDAIVVTTIGLGCGVIATIVKIVADRCGAEVEYYGAVIEGQGGKIVLGGYDSQEGAIREASETVGRCRANGVNRSALHVQRVGRK